jgi:uncharacterized protein (TIGR02246 family)
MINTKIKFKKMMTTFNDEAAVRQLHDEVLCAFNTLDLDKLLSLHSDKIVLMEPDMPAITGKAEVTRFFKKLQQQKLEYKLSYTVHELELFGKSAFVHGQVIKQITHNNEAPIHETVRFTTLSQKQDDGRWLMHAIVNNDQQPFFFSCVHLKNSERITKVTVTHDGLLEESTKYISESGPRDLVYRMILSTVNLLHNKPIIGQRVQKRQTDI